MLFADWEVRMVKNCDRGLKMLPEAAGRGQHFHAQGRSFSQYGPTLISYSKLFLQPITNGFLFTQFCQTLNRLARRLLRLVKNLPNERVTQILDKERCVKEQIFFDLLYVSCIYVTC